ncbi:carbon storage regulator CsrA [Actinokineospora cianjurensis]|uniref:Translational regulator CsrA n=1 Tax=Actinokineospora cianjurensis TaxID=585224 RepID=A0A421AVN7_9PSEU|nr:carbon storage regulator CsrA [Actinokineospora cianjurensis]
MLVLTRRTGESVRIGDEVTVTVLDIRGDVVRVGIQAPRSVTVHRDEVYRELRKANEQAARSVDEGAALLTDALRNRGQGPVPGPARLAVDTAPTPGPVPTPPAPARPVPTPPVPGPPVPGPARPADPRHPTPRPPGT